MITSTRGGPGGTSARLTDMEATADLLDEAAGDLAVILLRLGRAEADLADLVSVPLAPASGIALQARIAEFTGRAAHAEFDVATTAASLRSSAQAYRWAETASEKLFDEAMTVLGNLAGHVVRNLLVLGVPAVLPLVLPAVVTGVGYTLVRERLRDTALDEPIEELEEDLFDLIGVDPTALAGLGKDAKDTLVRAAFDHSDVLGGAFEGLLPGFLGGLLGVHPALQLAQEALPAGARPLPHDSTSLTGLVLLTLRSLGVGRPGPIDVDHRTEEVPPGSTVPDLPALFAQERASYSGTENGHVTVEEHVGADGTTSWIVYVPATTAWTVDGDGTTDMTTNLEAVSGRTSAMHAVVERAMEHAGVGPDEQVMLVGFSQGGIVAGSLASDPAFTSRYAVSSLLTVGSPISDFALDPDVDALSIEHEQDLVPDLDGEENPDTAHHTTVTVDLDRTAVARSEVFAGRPASEVDALVSSPGFAHSGLAYQATLTGLVAAGHPAVTAWSDRQKGFFDSRVTTRGHTTGKRR